MEKLNFMSNGDSNIKISIATNKSFTTEITDEFWKPKMPQNESTSCIASFLNLFFFLLLVPFRISKVTGIPGKYDMRVYRFQRILCGITYTVIVSLFFYVAVHRGLKLSKKAVGDSTMILSIIEWICDCGYFFISVKLSHLVWRGEAFLLEIVNSIRIPLQVDCTHHPYKTVFLVSVATATGILIFVVGLTSAFWLGETEYYDDLRLFFKFGESTVSDIIFNTIMYTSSGYGGILFVMGEGLLLCMTLELGQIETLLKSEVPWSPNLDLHRGLQCYRKLKTLTDLVKTHVGSLLLFYCISSVLFFAQAPYVLNEYRGKAEKILVLVFMITIPVWIVAAEFHYRVQNTTMDWISAHMTDNRLTWRDMLTLAAVSQELSLRPIAISCKYFTVTFSYLRSMLGTAFTYGIIVFQLNQKSQEKAIC